MMKNVFSYTVLLTLFLASTGASATTVTWTFSGAIDSEGVFSTFSIGDDWTFAMAFDSDQVGVNTVSGAAYSGTATFNSIAAGYSASDVSAVISIATAQNTMFVGINNPGALMPDVEFVNLPGQFFSPESIFVGLTFSQPVVSVDILDYIALDTVTLDSSYVIVRTPSAVPPTGALSSITVSTVPVPAAFWLFGSGLLGLVGVARSKRKS